MQFVLLGKSFTQRALENTKKSTIIEPTFLHWAKNLNCATVHLKLLPHQRIQLMRRPRQQLGPYDSISRVVALQQQLITQPYLVLLLLQLPRQTVDPFPSPKQSTLNKLFTYVHDGDDAFLFVLTLVYQISRHFRKNELSSNVSIDLFHSRLPAESLEGLPKGKIEIVRISSLFAARPSSRHFSVLFNYQCHVAVLLYCHFNVTLANLMRNEIDSQLGARTPTALLAPTINGVC